MDGARGRMLGWCDKKSYGERNWSKCYWWYNMELSGATGNFLTGVKNICGFNQHLAHTPSVDCFKKYYSTKACVNDDGKWFCFYCYCII